MVIFGAQRAQGVKGLSWTSFAAGFGFGISLLSVQAHSFANTAFAA